MDANEFSRHRPDWSGGPCRLSVILPVKNGQRYIEQAFLSIECCISDCDELIVIDDQSSDGTNRIVRDWQTRLPITLLEGAGLGPIKARNDGLRISRGRYVTFLDHDDYWPANRVASHVQLLDQDQGIDVVTGKTQYVSDGVEQDRPEFARTFGAIFHVHFGASTFRRNVFQRIGDFDEALAFSEDHDIFLRIREAGLRIAPYDEISLFYRIHASNMTRDKQLQEMQLFRVIQASLSRRRKQGGLLSDFPKNKR